MDHRQYQIQLYKVVVFRSLIYFQYIFNVYADDIIVAKKIKGSLPKLGFTEGDNCKTAYTDTVMRRLLSLGGLIITVFGLLTVTRGRLIARHVYRDSRLER